MTHGTRSGYARHGCRCPDCTLAQRDYMRDYYRRKRATVLSDAGAKTSGTTEIGPATLATSGATAPRSDP